MPFALYSAEEVGGAPSEQAPAPEATSAPDPGATPEAVAAPEPVGIQFDGQEYTPEVVQSWQSAHTNQQAFMAANTQRAQELASERQANAQLMTASPPLFKAAEYAIEVYQSHAASNPSSAGMEKALAGLKEAVSQAKGET